jgi:hypothetical protein
VFLLQVKAKFFTKPNQPDEEYGITPVSLVSTKHKSSTSVLTYASVLLHVLAYLHSTKQARTCVRTCVLTYLLVRKYVCAYVPMYNCVSMHALHTTYVIYGSVHMYTAKSRDTRTMLPRGYMCPESYTMSVYTSSA